MNERLAPEILQYQGALVERMRDRITQQARAARGTDRAMRGADAGA